MKMEIESYQRTMSKFFHLPLCTEDEKMFIFGSLGMLIRRAFFFFFPSSFSLSMNGGLGSELNGIATVTLSLMYCK